jgi:hypothetical protein
MERFPPEHERVVLLADTFPVKALSPSSMNKLMGSIKPEIKPRYCEFIEHKGSYAILVFKAKKGNLRIPN